MVSEHKLGKSEQAKNRGNAGKGRPKGVPNKTTGLLKDMILQALSDAGGVKYLRDVAVSDPKAFLPLVGKVLPLQVTGPEDGPLQLAAVKVEFVKARA